MSMMQIPGDGEKNASEENVVKMVCQPWEFETPYCAVKHLGSINTANKPNDGRMSANIKGYLLERVPKCIGSIVSR